jgi:hypothetical protein
MNSEPNSKEALIEIHIVKANRLDVQLYREQRRRCEEKWLILFLILFVIGFILFIVLVRHFYPENY